MKNNFRYCLLVSSLLCVVNACGDNNDGTEQDLCLNTVCNDDETCNPKSGLCEKVIIDLCAEKTCNEDEICNSLTGECEKLPPKVECENTEDCSDNKICRDNHCVFECESHEACSDGLVCKNNRCSACTEHADCDGNLICKDGKCDVECNEMSDCEENLVCRDHQCKPTCEVNEHCENKFICVNNQCMECAENSDCSGGFICDKNNCIECLEDSHCSDNKICFEEKCILECTAENDLDAECLPETPYCTANRCVECMDDNQCSENYHCTEHVCVPECDTDNDCSLTDKGDNKTPICVNHKCVECIENGSCENNYSCIDNACTLCSGVDADCDGIKDADDVCPFNAKYTHETGIDCNIVEEDGVKIFELYDVSELPKLHELLKEHTDESDIIVRQMRDFNLYDVIGAENVKDVPFKATSLSWYEKKTDSETGENSYIFHDSTKEETGYVIPDATCTGTWTPIDLNHVIFDGGGHSIAFSDKDGHSCSLVTSFFGSVQNSTIKNITLKYNVRGMTNSIFAESIQNSTVESVSIVGNINLETEPALEEKNITSYESIFDISRYWNFGIITAPEAINIDNAYRNISFTGNIVLQKPTENITNLFHVLFGGFLGNLNHCVVENAQLTVPEHFLADSRSVNGLAYDIKGQSEISNVHLNIPDIVMHNSSIFNGISTSINESVFTGDTEILIDNAIYFDTPLISKNNGINGIAGSIDFSSFENLTLHASVISPNQSSFSGISSSSRVAEFNGTIDLEFPILDLEKYNVTLLIRDTNLNAFKQPVKVSIGSLRADTYYGIYQCGGYTFDSNGFDIQIGDAEIESYYTGIAVNNVTSSMNGDNRIQISKLTIKNGDYFGLTEHIFHPISNIDIKIGELTAKTYHGISSIFFEPGASGEDPAEENPFEVSDIKIEIDNVKTESFFGLIPTCQGSIHDISMNIGEVTATDTFYALVQHLNNCNLSDIDFTSKTIKAYSSKENYFVADSCESDSSLNHIKIMTDLISSKEKIYLLETLDCKLTDSGFFLNAESSNSFIPFETIYENTNIENMSLYANVSIANLIFGKINYTNIPNINVTLNHALQPGPYNPETPIIIEGSYELPLIDAIRNAADYLARSNNNDAWLPLLNDYYSAIRAVYTTDADNREYGALNHIKIADEQCSNLKILNVFSWMHYNHFEQSIAQYFESERTHKLIHQKAVESPSSYNALNEITGNSTCVSSSIEGTELYKTALKIINYYWVKNSNDDAPFDQTLVTEYLNPDDYYLAFYAVKPVAAEYVIDARASIDVRPEDTLSNCASISDESCKSPWTLKSFVSPNGLPVSIPWIK